MLRMSWSLRRVVLWLLAQSVILSLVANAYQSHPIFTIHGSQAGGLKTAFRSPALGSSVGPVRVTSNGRLVELIWERGTTCVLFIATCHSCIRDVLSVYDRLHQQTGAVVVLARSTQGDIELARLRDGWGMPMYVEPPRSAGLAEFSSIPRPWVMLVQDGKIIYTQGSGETWQAAADEVTRLFKAHPNLVTRQNNSGELR